jgi:hypothetical protein
MKLLLVALALLMGTRAFSADAEVLDLSYSTQTKIIIALVSSDTAENTYIGEASYADVMERDLRFQNAGKLGKGNSVELSCTVGTDNMLDCMLTSYDEDESGESALVIGGKVYFPEFSSEVYVSEVKVFIAG